MADTPMSVYNKNQARADVEKGTELSRKPTGDVSPVATKPRAKVPKRLVFSIIIFLGLVALITTIIYVFIYKSLALEKFSKRLSEHMDEHYPDMDKDLKETYQHEIKKLFINGNVSSDVAFESESYIKFEKFLVDYSKEYDALDKPKRYLLFRKRFIDTKTQKNGKTYTTGINQFSDMTKKERKALLRPFQIPHKKFTKYELKRQELSLQWHSTDPVYLEKLKKAKNLETDVTDVTQLTGEDLDWRRADVVTPIKDQGKDCGSCWAFSAVASVESLYSLLNNMTLDLSEQYLINCETRCFGCDGGFADFALEFVRDRGLPTSKSLPYEGKDDLCQQVTGDKFFINSYYLFTGAQVLQKSLVVSPAVIGMGVADKLFDYKSGIYNDECAVKQNHAVLLVGEGYDPELKKRYWVIKNSWGKGWGEDGYLRLERTDQGRDKCDVLSFGLNPLLSYQHAR